MTEPVPAGPSPLRAPERLAWQRAEVVAVAAETPTARTLTLELERPSAHLPGQHYVVRLTAEDGYTASRSYSIASAPDGSARVDLTVERLADGEVSPFLVDVVEPGDELEVRGPIGRWFVWRGEGPALLVGGGSGVVPLMAMLRYARRTGTAHLLRAVVSVRSPAMLYYAGELPGPEVDVVYTRQAPDGVARPVGRLVAADLERALPDGATVYVCGSPPFADAVTDLLLDGGLVDAGRIRVERFGPTG